MPRIGPETTGRREANVGEVGVGADMSNRGGGAGGVAAGLGIATAIAEVVAGALGDDDDDGLLPEAFPGSASTLIVPTSSPPARSTSALPLPCSASALLRSPSNSSQVGNCPSPSSIDPPSFALITLNLLPPLTFLGRGTPPALALVLALLLLPAGTSPTLTPARLVASFVPKNLA